MLPSLVRAVCVVLMLAAPAWADDLADFNGAMEQVASHNRAAIGYLRTGNADLASLELDRLRDAWSRFGERFNGRRPAAFNGNALYAPLFTGVSARLVGADIMLKADRLDAARDALLKVRDDFYALRRASNIVVLADCVRDSNAAMEKLVVYDDPAIDLGKPEMAAGLSQAANAYGAIMEKCDVLAGDTVRKADEFRRLIDGAKNGLSFIPKAIATRDGDLVHRVMGELRAIDHLLFFRYG